MKHLFSFRLRGAKGKNKLPFGQKQINFKPSHMKNRLTSTEGGSTYYVCRPLSDKHKTLNLCVLCVSAVKKYSGRRYNISTSS